ncbi:hypothetical protein D8B31_11895 [Verminephrobacter eiseniae]|nr:hypothetical protein [Verminephrobacter eiseniae]MCW8185355.1 hypothetical protein [Verminephrobacter eiseniae]MCW8223994.1 hypothetical protein [Verminephrobacter eiseniae]
MTRSRRLSGRRVFEQVDACAPRLSERTPALCVTPQWRRTLLEPVLWELRAEKCAHLWQPPLAAAPQAEAFEVFERMVRGGRPSTVFTYYLSQEGRDNPVAVAMMSPRVAADSPEDGIPVLGRTYDVHPALRGHSIYAQVLRHRLALCQQQWGQGLFGVHIGTSSPRVEQVFRASFPGRTIRLGDEDLGDAGVVAALMGLTREFDRQLAEPVPGPLATAHAVVRAYLAHGTDAMPVAQALPALRALSGCQSAYRLLDQFLQRMPNLR